MGFWDIFKPIARIGSDILTGGGAEAFWTPEGMIESGIRSGGGNGGGQISNPATDISQVLGKTAGNAALGRMQEGQYLNNRDAVKARLYEAQQQAAKTALGLPEQGASEAVRGSLIKNLQDSGVEIPSGNQVAGHVVNFTGGTRPSDLTPEARQAGADLIAHGQKLIANPNSFLPTAPEMSAEPNESAWAKAAGIGSTIAGIGGVLGPAIARHGGHTSGPDNTFGDFAPSGTRMPGAGQGSDYDPYDVMSEQNPYEQFVNNQDDGNKYGENFWTQER